MRRAISTILALAVCGVAMSLGQDVRQPIVQPGPSEPDLLVILDRYYGLDMLHDLSNPVKPTSDRSTGLFRRAGAGPVTYKPEIALGLEVPIHGGFYENQESTENDMWSYQYKNTASDLEELKNLPPPLRPGSKTEFDPGDRVFGLYVANDQFHDKVFTMPDRVVAKSPRLAAQPYKAMIYPYRDPQTKEPVPNSYLICWEYSTNDDFQDVVCRVENVVLVRSENDR